MGNAKMNYNLINFDKDFLAQKIQQEKKANRKILIIK